MSSPSVSSLPGGNAAPSELSKNISRLRGISFCDAACCNVVGPREQMEDAHSMKYFSSSSSSSSTATKSSGSAKKKHNNNNNNNNNNAAVGSEITVFGVFDGHGGTTCSEYFASNLPEKLNEALRDVEKFKNFDSFFANNNNSSTSTKQQKEIEATITQVFVDLDKKYLTEVCRDDPGDNFYETCGTTAVVCILINNNNNNTNSKSNSKNTTNNQKSAQAIICNLGDSRCLVLRNSGKNKHQHQQQQQQNATTIPAASPAAPNFLEDTRAATAANLSLTTTVNTVNATNIMQNTNTLNNQTQTQQNGMVAPLTAALYSQQQQQSSSSSSQVAGATSTNEAGVELVFTTIDHKPTDNEEFQRIQKSKEMFHVDAEKVGGTLSVARAFGDKPFKPDLNPNTDPISSKPTITFVDILTDDVILLACDGVFDAPMFPQHQVVQFAGSRVFHHHDDDNNCSASAATATQMTNTSTSSCQQQQSSLAVICAEICHHANTCGSRDNISCMLVRICNNNNNNNTTSSSTSATTTTTPTLTKQFVAGPLPDYQNMWTLLKQSTEKNVGVISSKEAVARRIRFLRNISSSSCNTNKINTGSTNKDNENETNNNNNSSGMHLAVTSDSSLDRRLSATQLPSPLKSETTGCYLEQNSSSSVMNNNNNNNNNSQSVHEESPNSSSSGGATNNINTSINTTTGMTTSSSPSPTIQLSNTGKNMNINNMMMMIQHNTSNINNLSRSTNFSTPFMSEEQQKKEEGNMILDQEDEIQLFSVESSPLSLASEFLRLLGLLPQNSNSNGSSQSNNPNNKAGEVCNNSSSSGNDHNNNSSSLTLLSASSISTGNATTTTSSSQNISNTNNNTNYFDAEGNPIISDLDWASIYIQYVENASYVASGTSATVSPIASIGYHHHFSSRPNSQQRGGVNNNDVVGADDSLSGTSASMFSHIIQHSNQQAAAVAACEQDQELKTRALSWSNNYPKNPMMSASLNNDTNSSSNPTHQATHSSSSLGNQAELLMNLANQHELTSSEEYDEEEDDDKHVGGGGTFGTDSDDELLDS